MSSIRNPAVSGMFYPGDRTALDGMVNKCLKNSANIERRDNVIGVIVPHAGYVYSGNTAGFSYNSASFKGRKIFLIGPNHNSYPYYSAIYSGGKWKTPLGEATVDDSEINRFVDLANALVRDDSAHKMEHSLEVQIPFLQSVTANDFSFVPVVLGDQSEKTVIELADSLFPVMSEYIIVASSDLNHYENLKITEAKDKRIIDAIISLDVPSLYSVIRETESSPCGFGAIAFLMTITRKVGGKIILLHHTTSAEASGDESSVVGYASMVAFKQ